MFSDKGERSTPLRHLEWFLVLGLCLFGSFAAVYAIEPGSQTGGAHNKHGGVQVSFNVRVASDLSGTLLEGQSAAFEFAINDANNIPLSGLYPAAWIHPSSIDEEGSDKVCLDKVKTFIGGTLLSRAELDLNVYYVLTMNQDATIAVVDPLFGFGGSKLLTMLSLNGPGYDWAINQNQDQVIVSVPSANQLALIDVAGWRVSSTSDQVSLNNPRDLFIQPDQQYLWVLDDDGVAVFDLDSMQLHDRINTKAKPVSLEFSDDGVIAYLVTEKSIDIIDLASLTTARSIKHQGGGVSIDYSSRANELYLRHHATGDIWALDGQSDKPDVMISSAPGIGSLRFSPDGRWGILVNTDKDNLSIIDVAKGRIVQSGTVASKPEYIAFSDNIAYIRHAGSSDLYMIPLDDRDLGREGADIPTVDTPGGDRPAGQTDFPSGGDGIVQAPGSNAVLVANYHDKAVYFYKEGMAAPMGQFNNYGKHPRSVMAIDHSLRERDQKGTYSSYAALPVSGRYEAVMFMDSPRVVKCFPFIIGDANEIAKTALQGVTISDLISTKLLSRTSNSLRYLVDGAVSTDTEFTVDIYLASGQWRDSLRVKLNKDKVLAFDFTPPRSGLYSIRLNNRTLPRPREFTYDID